MLKTSGSSIIFIDTLIIVFMLPLFIQTSGQNRIYIYVPGTVTMSEAKQYCRDHYTDVATFRSQADIDALPAQSCIDGRCWIGLERNMNNTSDWHWSDGDEAIFRNWYSGEPNGLTKQENCVMMLTSLWYDISCNDICPFLCYEDEPILVQETKTWEDALEHCRNLHLDPFSQSNFFKHVYDLLHIRSADLNTTATKAVVDAQTQEVWIGLRFLAGKWLWLDGTPLSNQLDVCPAAGNNCGTVAKTGELKFSNCSDKRMFFCSRN
ncbi:hypothetical protein Q5P01_006119 [Channa striata]|uniref:C-type lectin domain-containing protein n=1 Tax=Channa striata TaxID=64152 RepID=A0AA88SYE9_CHASR|nr:hypothetical protein Q5P01_006119 [Channa striata]